MRLHGHKTMRVTPMHWGAHKTHNLFYWSPELQHYTHTDECNDTLWRTTETNLTPRDVRFSSSGSSTKTSWFPQTRQLGTGYTDVDRKNETKITERTKTSAALRFPPQRWLFLYNSTSREVFYFPYITAFSTIVFGIKYNEDTEDTFYPFRLTFNVRKCVIN